MTVVRRRPERRLLTVEAAGHRLGVSRSTMYRLINDREIDAVLIRGSRRVSTDALDRYVRRLEQAPYSAVADTAERAEHTSGVRGSRRMTR